MYPLDHCPSFWFWLSVPYVLSQNQLIYGLLCQVHLYPSRSPSDVSPMSHLILSNTKHQRNFLIAEALYFYIQRVHDMEKNMEKGYVSSVYLTFFTFTNHIGDGDYQSLHQWLLVVMPAKKWYHVYAQN